MLFKLLLIHGNLTDLFNVEKKLNVVWYKIKTVTMMKVTVEMMV